eukprot:tig00020603_g11802.t1
MDQRRAAATAADASQPRINTRFRTQKASAAMVVEAKAAGTAAEGLRKQRAADRPAAPKKGSIQDGPVFKYPSKGGEPPGEFVVKRLRETRLMRAGAFILRMPQVAGRTWHPYVEDFRERLDSHTVLTVSMNPAEWEMGKRASEDAQYMQVRDFARIAEEISRDYEPLELDRAGAQMQHALATRRNIPARYVNENMTFPRWAYNEGCKYSDFMLENVVSDPHCLMHAVTEKISGINIPWMYIGMPDPAPSLPSSLLAPRPVRRRPPARPTPPSRTATRAPRGTPILPPWTFFCMHLEDELLGSFNYVSYGAPKVWYVLAPEDRPRLQDYVRDKYPHFVGERSAVLEGPLPAKTLFFDPQELVEAGFRVWRLVQRPGDIVCTDYGCFHQGHGFSNWGSRSPTPAMPRPAPARPASSPGSRGLGPSAIGLPAPPRPGLGLTPFRGDQGVNMGFNIAESVNFAWGDWLDAWAAGERADDILRCKPSGINVQRVLSRIMLAKLLARPDDVKSWPEVVDIQNSPQYRNALAGVLEEELGGRERARLLFDNAPALRGHRDLGREHKVGVINAEVDGCHACHRRSALSHLLCSGPVSCKTRSACVRHAHSMRCVMEGRHGCTLFVTVETPELRRLAARFPPLPVEGPKKRARAARGFGDDFETDLRPGAKQARPAAASPAPSPSPPPPPPPRPRLR